MRLSRLDLTRYGCFTNRSITFMGKEANKPDLHLIYGRNEAGKSTLLNAYMDLLFGIGAQSPFDFLHPYNTMQIGALIEFTEGKEEFFRIKKVPGGLLDKAGKQIGDGVIQRELGGLNRERYHTMFSLDNASLQKGGQSILASEGDLGALLFSASAGLADLSQRLSDVTVAAETFYKLRARKGDLRDLKDRLAEIKSERAKLDTQVSVYAELTNTRDRLQGGYKAAVEEEGQTSARIAEISRLLLALPEAAELNRNEDQLRDLLDLPKVPASWNSDLEQLKREDAVLSAEQQRIKDALDLVTDEIEGLVVNENALKLQTEMGKFKELRSRSVGAAVDLPVKREERTTHKGIIEGILARLERSSEENPEHLVLSVSVSGGLLRLIESWSGVESKQQTATEERERAVNALSIAKTAVSWQDDVPNMPGPGESEIASLSVLLSEASTVDYTRRTSMAQDALKAAKSRLDQQLKLLAPWSGSVEELVGMECPSSENVQNRKGLLSAADNELKLHNDEYDRIEEEREDVKLELGAISSATGVLSDQDIKKIREERDAAWSQHKRDMQSESAQLFESALQSHDEAIDNRFDHLSEVEKHRQLQVKLAHLTASLGPAQRKRDSAAEAHQQMLNRISESVAKLSPSLESFSTDLANLETWLSRRDRALELWDAVEVANQAKAAADIELANMTTNLTDALAITGHQVPQGSEIKNLIAAAKQIVGEYAKQRETRKRIAELGDSVAERRNEEAKAQRVVDEWNTKWAAACKGCWIGEIASPTIDTVREILSELPRLETALTELKSIERRIEGMESDDRDLLSECKYLAAALNLDTEGPASAIAERIEAFMQSVHDTLSARDVKENEQAKYKSEQKTLTGQLERHTTRKGEMVKVLGVDSLADIELKLAEVEKRDALSERVTGQKASIMRILEKNNYAEVEVALDSAVQEDLNAELARLNGMLPDQQRRARELYAEYCKAKDHVSAVGADAKIAQIEEQKRTKLIEINDRAEEYLRLRAGTLAAEIALQAYRERHRSTMLERASDTFRRICSDQYTGLKTQPNGATETLVAQVSKGGSRTDEELSDGARRQLYFSLRIAGYHEFVRNHPSLPFIADDILESFDNPRAGETFRLLGEMSELGQVIYLTHHEHLCEIAKKVCPSVNIYSLEEMGLEPVLN